LNRSKSDDPAADFSKDGDLRGSRRPSSTPRGTRSRPRPRSTARTCSAPRRAGPTRPATGPVPRSMTGSRRVEQLRRLRPQRIGQRLLVLLRLGRLL